jgi:hypothetical protein
MSFGASGTAIATPSYVKIQRIKDTPSGNGQSQNRFKELLRATKAKI